MGEQASYGTVKWRQDLYSTLTGSLLCFLLFVDQTGELAHKTISHLGPYLIVGLTVIVVVAIVACFKCLKYIRTKSKSTGKSLNAFVSKFDVYCFIFLT